MSTQEHGHDPQGKANLAKLEQLKRILDRLMARALQRGFYGVVEVKMPVQDGVIQHITHSVEESTR